MLLNAENRVFTARRLDNPADYWQMPQGGIDPGESPREAAFRELTEETGIAPDRAELLAESGGWLHYSLPDELVGKIWKGKYCGQSQKWFAMRFLGSDDEVDIEQEHPEFSEWRWAAPESLPRKIVPFKVQLYREVLAEFAHLFD
ncbi:RNA pyrophosphohydrolase [Pacificimonas flava]|uniref:RNA pyrophosphohydrolase n=3 Tax=Sphingosinicellaceae TaxID=2820280 RepID=A0A219B935_9SPHN|nr:RNA pyrophosphohydrolase [Pacificimonas aurantium]OWV34636.1 RNA pyrophosphohydrolase [Pacificimonas flava]